MAGRIRVVNPGLDAIQVLRAYLKKYPFTQEFFKENISLDLDTFAQRFGVKLYRLSPLLSTTWTIKFDSHSGKK